MAVTHDFKKFPELSNRQLEEMRFDSPHPQIEKDFEALVVRVHDGDTITLRGAGRDFDFPLRFLDIDTPEMNAGGEEARDWLRGQILDENVEIKINKKNRVDKWGRLLGKVFHRGLDMGDSMMRLGLATTFSNRREGQLQSFEEILARG